MKKIISFMMLIGMVLVVGTVFAEEYVTKTKDPTLDPDSFINTLDPSNAPVMEETGYREEGMRGSAAGGMREDPDSLINTLDPSNAPWEALPRTKAARVVTREKETLIDYIAPVIDPN